MMFIREKIFFTKQDTKYVYGIAIILMVLHHLLGFPQRFNYELINVFPFEYQVGVFGKICVGMYAFVTGYGLAVNVKSRMKENVYTAFKRVIGFYKKFWLVYIIFIPVGILTSEINAPLSSYIYNFFGMKSSFNGEWWYIREYVLMLLSFPIVWEMINFCDTYKKGVKYFLFCILLIILRYFSPYLALSFLGMIFQKYSLFEKIHSLKLNAKRPLLFSLFLIFMVVFVRVINPSVKLDVFIVPIFLFALINIKNTINYNCRMVELLGELSVFIWLIHTFYMYHYFQNAVLVFKYSVSVLLITLFLSVATAYILNMIYKKVFI